MLNSWHWTATYTLWWWSRVWYVCLTELAVQFAEMPPKPRKGHSTGIGIGTGMSFFKRYPALPGCGSCGIMIMSFDPIEPRYPNISVWHNFRLHLILKVCRKAFIIFWLSGSGKNGKIHQNYWIFLTKSHTFRFFYVTSLWQLMSTSIL